MAPAGRGRPLPGAAASWARRRERRRPPSARSHRRRHRRRRAVRRRHRRRRARGAPGPRSTPREAEHPRLQPRDWPTRPAPPPPPSTRRVAAGEDPGPLAGVPVALKDNLCTRGIATTCSSKILEGWRPPYDATVVAAARRRRRRRRRQDQPRRVRHGQLHRELGLRPHPQPARHHPGAGRVVRRQRRRGGRRLRAALARLRHRRLDPPARRAVRRGRASSPPTGWSAATASSPSPQSLDQIGPFATTVADAALLLEVIAGHDPMDSTSIAAARAPTSGRHLDDGVEGLRVGLVTRADGRGHRPRRRRPGHEAAERPRGRRRHGRARCRSRPSPTACRPTT